MNNFRITPKRHNSNSNSNTKHNSNNNNNNNNNDNDNINNNNNNNNAPPPSIDDEVNFAHEGEEERKETQEGATFIQNGAATQRPLAQQQKKQMEWTSRKGGRTQKVAAEAPKDKTKEQAKRDKQVAPEAAKAPSCLHFGGVHTLVECPNLTDKQLGQIHVQLVAHEEEMRHKENVCSN